MALPTRSSTTERSPARGTTRRFGLSRLPWTAIVLGVGAFALLGVGIAGLLLAPIVGGLALVVIAIWIALKRRPRPSHEDRPPTGP